MKFLGTDQLSSTCFPSTRFLDALASLAFKSSVTNFVTFSDLQSSQSPPSPPSSQSPQAPQSTQSPQSLKSPQFNEFYKFYSCIFGSTFVHLFLGAQRVVRLNPPLVLIPLIVSAAARE